MIVDWKRNSQLEEQFWNNYPVLGVGKTMEVSSLLSALQGLTRVQDAQMCSLTMLCGIRQLNSDLANSLFLKNVIYLGLTCSINLVGSNFYSLDLHCLREGTVPFHPHI